MEAFLVFVAIPVTVVAIVALLAYTAVATARSFGARPQAPAGNVVAFRARQAPEAVGDVRKAA